MRLGVPGKNRRVPPARRLLRGDREGEWGEHDGGRGRQVTRVFCDKSVAIKRISIQMGGVSLKCLYMEGAQYSCSDLQRGSKWAVLPVFFYRAGV